MSRHDTGEVRQQSLHPFFLIVVHIELLCLDSPACLQDIVIIGGEVNPKIHIVWQNVLLYLYKLM